MFKLLSCRQFAKRCKVSESAIRKAIKEGRLKAHKIDYAWVIREYRTLRYVAQRSYQRGRKSKYEM